MANEENLALRDEVRIRNYRLTERAVANGRWVVLIFLLFYVNVVKPQGWPIILINVLILMASVYNFFILFAIRRRNFFSVNLTLFSMYGDMTAAGVGFYFTGGVESPFFFLWYLTLFTAGARFGFLKSFLLQLPMAVIYAGFVYHASRIPGFDVVNRLVPGLFSLTVVSLFGAIFSREEHYMLRVMEGFHKESITDRLTGLYNYAYFIDELKKEQARSNRTHSPFSLVIFDLDFFKKVNDTWGHEKGNVLLKEVANILRTNARLMDTVARYGGEEFVILMPNSGEAELEIAERIRKKVEESEFSGITDKPVKITISGGLCSYPRDASTIFELLDRADSGLYQAKSLGRNRVCRYKKGQHASAPVMLSHV